MQADHHWSVILYNQLQILMLCGRNFCLMITLRSSPHQRVLLLHRYCLLCPRNNFTSIFVTTPSSSTMAPWFPEVALLNYVWWLDIKGKLDTKILSPEIRYAAYFVCNLADYRDGFDARPVVLGVGRPDRWDVKQSVFLDPRRNAPQVTRQRGNGWMEVKMGEFCTENRDDGEVTCSLRETDDYTTKHGPIVEGIEFRPEVVV